MSADPHQQARVREAAQQSAQPTSSELEPASCPLPLSERPEIVLGHGAGGRLGRELVERLFVPAFATPQLSLLGDAALLDGLLGRAPTGAGTDRRDTPAIALTTDAFVVSPLFFPGGDIGRLAICGTVNDLAVSGAYPAAIAAAMILEEGLPLEELTRVVASMRAACDEAGVALVAGDTKVVERGKGDALFVTTTGVGVVAPDHRHLSSPSGVRAGDAVVVSGTIGDHGIAIMSLREGIAFETELRSDCAPLSELIGALLTEQPELVRWMRDPTRGGVAATLHELCAATELGVELDEAALPIDEAVRGACELLGLEPLSVANEGKVIAVVDGDRVDEALGRLRSHPLGSRAACIGRVVEDHPGVLTMRSSIGARRIVAELLGEQLPRIC